MAEHLPNVTNQITAAELASALLHAWRELFGSTPARTSILLIVAQSAHETGRWAKGLHCFNIGNIKCSEGDGRDFTMFRCREVIGGKNVYFDPPHPATRFRAFRTLAEGAIDHLAFLRGSKRYGAAWKAVERGAPTAFAQTLKDGGYYTDPVEVYAKALNAFVKEFDRTLPAELEPPVIDAEAAARAQGLVALSLRELGGEFVTGTTEAPPDPGRAQTDDEASAATKRS
jgi:hypothetical protein